MKWIKTKCFYSVLLSLGFLSLLSVFSLLTVNDTFALEDLTLTINSSNYSTNFQYLCSNTNSSVSDCTGYKYAVLTSASSCSTFSSNTRFDFQYNSSDLSSIFNLYPFSISSFLLEFTNLYSFFFRESSNVSNFPSDCFFTIILSENNPLASGIIPSGSLSITENGTYDVTNYAQAVVDVPTSSGGGDGGTDVSEIVKALYTLGGVILVVYFFYCIYRMIIKPLRS